MSFSQNNFPDLDLESDFPEAGTHTSTKNNNSEKRPAAQKEAFHQNVFFLPQDSSLSVQKSAAL